MTDAPPGPTNGARASGPDLRRSILDTTRHMLVEEGYHGLSMRRIARAVGCSATSIYLHFESKDALVHTLIDEGMQRLYAALEGAGGEDDPVVRLGRLCHAYVAFGVENPEYYEAMFMLHPARMERYPPEKYRRARRNLEWFAAALADGAASGDFVIEDPDTGASLIWAALHGAVALLIARRLDVRIDAAAFADAVIQHAVDGFRPAGAAAPSS